MIFGECPHCHAYIFTTLANVALPVYSKEICSNCKKEYWLKHSRIEPQVFAERPEGLTKAEVPNAGNG